ncbi:MAG: thiolase family protein [Novosphingobium sp.]|nr:thiolase family protein [Novosphingobium sp.]
MPDKAVHIVGVGMTKFGIDLARTVKDLTRQAVDEALADANCAASLVEAAWFANTSQGMLEGQHMIRGQAALRPLGFVGIPIVNVENACASASTALFEAANYLKAGAADIVLAVGAEKLSHQDRGRSLAVFDAGWDVALTDQSRAALLALGGMDDARLPPPAERRSLFMDIYAAFARQHMRLYGSTAEQFAAVAAKNHVHSVHNERAQFRRPYTIEEVLADRPIAWPLTLPMCAPVSDGAAAAILCTDKGLERLGAASRAIRLRACVPGTSIDRAPDDLDRHIGRITALKAYGAASLGPEDVDVAEVHDATAVGEVIQVENLGLVPRGLGGEAALQGQTCLGGRIPVNPSGGLESKGHPIGATGLAQIFELVTQLRGEAGQRQVDNATVAIAENGGGLWGVEEAVCAISILSR